MYKCNSIFIFVLLGHISVNFVQTQHASPVYIKVSRGTGKPKSDGITTSYVKETNNFPFKTVQDLKNNLQLKSLLPSPNNALQSEEIQSKVKQDRVLKVDQLYPTYTVQMPPTIPHENEESQPTIETERNADIYTMVSQPRSINKIDNGEQTQVSKTASSKSSFQIYKLPPDLAQQIRQHLLENKEVTSTNKSSGDNIQKEKNMIKPVKKLAMNSVYSDRSNKHELSKQAVPQMIPNAEERSSYTWYYPAPKIKQAVHNNNHMNLPVSRNLVETSSNPMMKDPPKKQYRTPDPNFSNNEMMVNSNAITPQQQNQQMTVDRPASTSMTPMKEPQNTPRSVMEGLKQGLQQVLPNYDFESSQGFPMSQSPFGSPPQIFQHPGDHSSYHVEELVPSYNYVNEVTEKFDDEEYKEKYLEETAKFIGGEIATLFGKTT